MRSSTPALPLTRILVMDLPTTTGSVVGRPSRLRYVQIIITCLLLAALWWFVDWTSVFHALAGASIGWVAVIVLLVGLERATLNLKWRALLSAGGLRLGYFRLFRIQLAANALGSLLPSSIGVDALRIAGLWRWPEQRATALAATLLDRLSTALATAVVGASMVLLVAAVLVGHTGVIIISSAAVFGILVIGLLISPPGRALVNSLAQRLPAGIKAKFDSAADATRKIFRDRSAILTSLWTSLAAIGLRVLIGKALLLACGVDVPLATLGYVLPVVWGLTMLPISIGGIGVQDSAYVLLLGQAGVDAPTAIAVSLLDHLLSRSPLLIGIFFWRDVTIQRPDIVARDQTR
jgi:uncharacterized protein (TIRG00374 family)